MAVRLMSVRQTRTENDGTTKIVATVFADAKTDITTNMSIGDQVIDFGSTAYTKDLDVAKCDSNGSWTWV